MGIKLQPAQQGTCDSRADSLLRAQSKAFHSKGQAPTSPEKQSRWLRTEYVSDTDRILASHLRMLTSGFGFFNFILSETLISTAHILLAEGYFTLLLQWPAHHIFPI